MDTTPAQPAEPYDGPSLTLCVREGCTRPGYLHLVTGAGNPTSDGNYRGDSWCSRQHLVDDLHADLVKESR